MVKGLLSMTTIGENNLLSWVHALVAGRELVLVGEGQGLARLLLAENEGEMVEKRARLEPVKKTSQGKIRQSFTNVCEQ